MLGFLGSVGGFRKWSPVRDFRCNRIRGQAAPFLMSSPVSSITTSLVEEVADERKDEKQRSFQLSTGERARTVVHTSRSGTLCTASVRHEGAPFGSHVDYILDDDGRPIVLLADSAAHTMNLKASNNVSLFCQPVENFGQSGGRATLVGDIARVSRVDLEELVDHYVDVHPHAREALKYTDSFHFYRMNVTDVYFVGGYGVSATWVDADAYTKAEADPIAFDAARLIDRLNSSPLGEIRSLCTVFCDVSSEFEATIVSLDRLGVDLRITSTQGTDEFRLCFREDISNTFDAQSSLVKLLQEAWERDNGYEEDWQDAPPLDVVKYYTRVRESQE